MGGRKTSSDSRLRGTRHGASARGGHTQTPPRVDPLPQAWWNKEEGLGSSLSEDKYSHFNLWGVSQPPAFGVANSPSGLFNGQGMGGGGAAAAAAHSHGGGGGGGGGRLIPADIVPGLYSHSSLTSSGMVGSSGKGAGAGGIGMGFGNDNGNSNGMGGGGGGEVGGDEGEFMSYIWRLEARIEALEQQNAALLMSLQQQPRRSGAEAEVAIASSGGGAVLSSNTPEFRPTHPVRVPVPVLNPSSLLSPPAESVGVGGVSIGGATVAEGSDKLKIHERLSTLEGRQTSLQKKIACMDTLFGPSTAAWGRSVKEVLTRLGDSPEAPGGGPLHVKDMAAKKPAAAASTAVAGGAPKAAGSNLGGSGETGGAEGALQIKTSGLPADTN